MPGPQTLALRPLEMDPGSRVYHQDALESNEIWSRLFHGEERLRCHAPLEIDSRRKALHPLAYQVIDFSQSPKSRKAPCVARPNCVSVQDMSTTAR